VRHGSQSMKLKIRGDSSSEDIQKAIRNRLQLFDQQFMLVDEEGCDVVLDHTLTTGAYTIQVVGEKHSGCKCGPSCKCTENGGECKCGSGKTTFAVVGCAGNVGTSAIQALSKTFGGSHTILAVTRDIDGKKAAGLEGPGVQKVKGDMSEKAGLTTTLKGADNILIVSPGVLERAKLATSAYEAAKAAGAKLIVVISVSNAYTDTIFGRQFGELEDNIKKLGGPYCFLRLPLFLENLWANKGSIQAQGAFYGPSKPDAKISSILVSDIGQAVAAIFADPKKHVGKTYNLSCTPFSNNELAQIFSKAAGKEVKYVQVPYEGAKQSFMGMGLGLLEWQVDGILELYKLGDAGKYSYPDDYQPITGKAPTSVETFVTTQMAGALK